MSTPASEDRLKKLLRTNMPSSAPQPAMAPQSHVEVNVN